MKTYKCYGVTVSAAMVAYRLLGRCLCELDNKGTLVKAVSNGFEHQDHVDRVNEKLQQEKGDE